MSKRWIHGLVAAAVAALFVVPLVGHATDLPGETTVASAACNGTTDSHGNGVCTKSFTLDKAGFVSNVITHGNVDELLVSGGKVNVTWTDAVNKVVYSADCTLLGLSVNGVGPLDLQDATCATSTPMSSYADGAQTLTVTVTGATCPSSMTACKYSGDIEVHSPDSLY